MPEINKSLATKIEKLDDEQRLVYGTVMESDIEDLQGDIISKDDLEKACHNFMLNYQQFGEVHKTINSNVKVVECYIDKSTINWQWKVVAKVFDDAVWEKIKSGEYASFSVGGVGIREEIAA